MGIESNNSLIVMNKKTQVLEKLRNTRAVIMKNSEKDALHSSAYYHAFELLSHRFEKKLEESILFNELEPDWRYEISYSYEGISLSVVHYQHHGFIDEHPITEDDQEYVLFTAPAHFLRVDEYAQVFNVGEGTVRQWIRRAKIRTAKKYGNEWRISELTDPPKRGYTPAHYNWNEELIGVPEEFAFLSGKGSITIRKSEVESQEFIVSLWDRGEGNSSKTFSIDSATRERLEMYLIGNPEIHYVQAYHESMIWDLMKAWKQEENNDMNS